jgi:hypothetical protein
MKIPKAEEYLKEKGLLEVMSTEDLIEFAKLHVIAQREAILEKAFVTHKETEKGDEYLINRDSVLGAYPLNNIS